MSSCRLALIGAGGFAGAHIKAALYLVEHGLAKVALTTVVARSDTNFARLRARFPAVHYTTDLAAVLADPAIDGVIVCVPHDQHAAIAQQVLAAGKHLLLEKPMACSLAEGEAIVAAAEAAQRQLMIGQCERYEADNQNLKMHLEAQLVGEVHAIRLDAMQDAAGFIPDDHWYRDGAVAGGGVTRSVGVHRLDLARYFFGDVAWVQAHAQTVSPTFKRGAEDLMLGSMGFANGVLGHFYFSWAAAKVPYSEGIQIFGDRGTVHGIPAEPAQFGTLQYSLADRQHAENPFAAQFSGFTPLPVLQTAPTTDAVTNQLAHFVACCQDGTEPLSSGRDNLGTLAVVDAIEASARQGGERITLSQQVPYAG